MPYVRPLVTVWIALAGLSVLTTALTLVETSGRGRIAAVAALLVLAGLKARLILARYLGLATSRFWTSTFDLVIAVFLAAGFALYLAGGPS